MKYDFNDTDRIAQRLISGLNNTWEGCVYGAMEEMETRCESPIEVMLGSAVLLGGLLYDGPSKIGKRMFSVHSGDNIDFDSALIAMVPQYNWKKFRIDFAFFTRRGNVPLFVECDGHDFHERTKEQAARDRSKDRDIQAAGITILRFTGSEIYRNVDRCVVEIINAVGRISDKRSEGPK